MKHVIFGTLSKAQDQPNLGIYALATCNMSLSEFESWSITVYLKATFILGQSSMGHQTQEISLPLRFSKEKPFASLQGQGTMHIRTLCSGSIAFSSLVTSSNLINQFLFASSRMENFLNHFLASSRTSLSMSKNLEIVFIILVSQAINVIF